ncbi:MAG: MFS transporter [Spirosomaceae bacterium]|jgi:MFS family permease|nr:MFS transporter [Spirosomataceae bacterium]
MTTHLKTYFTHSRSIALGAVFSCFGFLFGNWVTLIPYVKAKFGFDDAQLGLLLLSMPLAATMSNPIATLVISRFGMRQTTLWGLVAMSFAYILPVQMSSIWATACALGVVGLTLSITNVAMNTCVTSVERQEGIFIMSTSHGMFSMGGMVGSALASVLIGMRTAPSIHVLIASGLVLMVLLAVWKTILGIFEEKIVAASSSSKFAWPTPVLWGMIAISLCTNITEGAMSDWTAVYMREVVVANDFYIGWGFASYALLMATGRFLGDTMIPRYGRRRLLVGGGILAALGIILAVFLPFTFSAITGFALVGLGVSCCAPILYGSAARIPDMAKGAGLATLNTFSIAGFLVGPALIGFVSNAVNLAFAIGIVAVLAMLWAFLSNKAKLY